MKSYGELETVFKDNDASSIFPEVYGFSVKYTERDSDKLSAMFTFGNTTKGYYLQFKTLYYRDNPIYDRNSDFEIFCLQSRTQTTR